MNKMTRRSAVVSLAAFSQAWRFAQAETTDQ